MRKNGVRKELPTRGREWDRRWMLDQRSSRAWLWLSDHDKNSRFALKYALEKCLISQDEVIKLVHVNLRSANSAEAATDPVTSGNTPDSFVPFRCFCVCKMMQSEMVVLEDYDVAAALVEYVRRCHIQALFLGAPSRGSFSRLFKKVDVPRMMMKLAHSFCNAYIIGKGDVMSARPTTMWITPPIFFTQQSQPQLRQDNHHPPLEHSGTSYHEVEDGLSVSSGRLSMESDLLSFLQGLRDQRKVSYVGYRPKRRHSRRMRGKLKSTSFHHPTNAFSWIRRNMIHDMHRLSPFCTIWTMPKDHPSFDSQTLKLYWPEYIMFIP